jgi:hypothetical protein
MPCRYILRATEFAINPGEARDRSRLGTEASRLEAQRTNLNNVALRSC